MTPGWSLVEEKRALRRHDAGGARACDRQRAGAHGAGGGRGAAGAARAAWGRGSSRPTCPPAASWTSPSWWPSGWRRGRRWSTRGWRRSGRGCAFTSWWARHADGGRGVRHPGAAGGRARDPGRGHRRACWCRGWPSTRQGRRLGYGGGYYDELAQRLRAHGRGFLVGLGYDFQLVERCPTGDGDVALDCIVTDARVVRCDGKQP